MKYLTVKVLLETKGTVYRDLLLSETDRLNIVHKSIKKAFDFKGDQLASFIQENEGWGNDLEIPLENLMDAESKEMKDVTIGELLKEEGDQLLYNYDYLNEWKFYLEVIEVKTIDKKEDTPKLLKKHGKSPDENEKKLTGDDAESILMNAILGDDLNVDDEDDFDDNPFESGDYDSLDDYEEFQ